MFELANFFIQAFFFNGVWSKLLQWEKSLWHSTNSETRLIQFTKKKKKTPKTTHTAPFLIFFGQKT